MLIQFLSTLHTGDAIFLKNLLSILKVIFCTMYSYGDS